MAKFATDKQVAYLKALGYASATPAEKLTRLGASYQIEKLESLQPNKNSSL
jgi:hypothetical protein